jgi:hypothetical protein
MTPSPKFLLALLCVTLALLVGFCPLRYTPPGRYPPAAASPR